MFNPGLKKIYERDDYAAARYYVDTCMGQMLLISDAGKMSSRKEAQREVYWSALVIFEHTIFYRNVIAIENALHHELPAAFVMELQNILMMAHGKASDETEEFYRHHDMQTKLGKCVDFLVHVRNSWGQVTPKWSRTLAKYNKTAM